MSVSKMKNCKTCGTAIAKSAKTCPSCGAKNKKPIGRIILLILVIVALAAYGVRTMQYNSTNQAMIVANGEELTWDDYKELYHEYYMNGKVLEFEDTYYPATVTMTGTIKQISSAIDGNTIGKDNIPTKSTKYVTTIRVDDLCEYRVVYGYYEQDQYDFSQFSVGDTVTVTGMLGTLYQTSIIPERLDNELRIIGTLDGITK